MRFFNSTVDDALTAIRFQSQTIPHSMKEPAVSICIPAYNSERYVAECIDSVLAQSFSDFEVILSDNASTDRTWDIMESYTDPRIRRFRQAANIGFHENFNFTIAEARGQLIHPFCADDVMLPHLLNDQVALLNRYHLASLGSCEAIVTDEQLRSTNMLGCLKWYHTRKEILCHLQNPFYNPVGGPSNFLFRSRHREFATFESRYMYLSDLHLALKLLRCGDYVALPEPGYLYRRHATTVTNSLCPNDVQLSDWTNLAIEHEFMTASGSARLCLASPNELIQTRIAKWRKDNLSLKHRVASYLLAHLRRHT